MNINIMNTDWTLIDVSGDKQISNQGSTVVRLKQSASKPTETNDGLLLSNYSQPYASVIITGSDPVWALPIGVSGRLNVQVI